jgi:uncharacterized membrane protein
MTTEETVHSATLLSEDAFRHFFEYLILGIDIVAGIVIAISIIRGFIMYLKIIRKSPLEQTKSEVNIKRFIGSGLILALDIEVGSDVIRTILDPLPQELLALAVIVAIRIALSWALSKDIVGEPDNK